MKRLLPFIIGILVLIGLLVCLPFLLQTSKYRAQLAAFLSQRLQHTVLINKLDIGLFPPTLKLSDVSMLNPQQDANLFHAQTVEVPLDWGGLFQFKTVPAAVVAGSWEATLRRKADGSWAFDEWLPPLAQLASAERWPLNKVTLGTGVLHLLDPFNPASQELAVQVHDAGVDRARQYATASGSLSSGSSTANFVFQGQGHFLASPQWSGTLQFTDQSWQWAVDIKEAGDHLELIGKSAEWPFDFAYGLFRFYSRWDTPIAVASQPLTLQQWDTHVMADPNKVTFSHTANVAGGQSEVQGSVTLAGGMVPMVIATAAVRGVNVQALGSALWGDPRWDGSATGLAHVEVALSSEPWSTARGGGVFEVKSGKYHWPEISAKSLSKAHMMAYFQKKFPGFLQSGLAFNKLSGRWQAAGGTISLDSGFCDLGDVKTAIVAAIDGPRHGVDAYVRLQIHETHPDLVKAISPGYVYGGGSHAVIQPIFGHLQGTWDEWHLKSTHSSKIPAALRNKLQKAITQK